MTPEGKVKQWFKDRVDERYGHLPIWWYAPKGGAYGQAGVGDRVMMVESVAAMIEIKADGNSPTSLQLKKLREFRDAGGVAASLIGKDIAKVRAIFAEIDRRRELWRSLLQSTTGQPTRAESPSGTSVTP